MKIKKKLFSVGLSFLMILTMITPVVAADSSVLEGQVFSDMPTDWSAKALENAVSNGLLSGYENKITPKQNLTRSQMAAIVTRVFKPIATDKAVLSSFTDINKSAWYYDDMAKAVQMEVITGSENQLRPDSSITREEVFTVLARAFKLSGDSENILDVFTDKDSVSEWATESTAALVKAGYVSGSNGKLNPKQNITRAEFAQLMDNIIKSYITKAGTYTEDISGNVIINVPDVTLKNIKITGDLIIGDGVGDGDINLDNVIITGRTLIRGGGVNSIRISGNSEIQNIIVARVDGQIRVFAEDGTVIGEITVDGSDDVIIEGNLGIVTIIASDVNVIATNARITSGVVEGDRSKIIVSQNSSITSAEIRGTRAEIIVEKGSTIENVVVNGRDANISGQGEIGKVEANADNAIVSTPGTRVIAADAVTGVKAGNINVGEGNTETVPGSQTDNNNYSSDDSSNDNPQITYALTSYTPITLNQTGDIAHNNVQYQSAAAVMAALPSEIAVTLENTTVINVPITWTDTDTYNAAEAGTYTFTATWGVIPEGADNNNNLVSPTVEVTVTAGIADTPEEYFTFDSDSKTIIAYDIEGGGTDVSIPSTISGVAVEHIGESAFRSSGGDKKRSIVTMKGSYDGLKLTSVYIPDSVKTIGYSAFSGNDLTVIALPDSITAIDERAFANNPITEMDIPSSVTSIGEDIFNGCTILVEINVDLNNNSYSSADGVLFNKDKTTLIQFPFAKTGSYIVPDGVTTISDYAFRYCEDLTGITFPDGLIHIGDSAFSSCTSLSGTIIIPDSVTSIGYETFSYCEGLESVIIGDGVESIGNNAFYYCIELESVIIGDGVESLGDSAFQYCSKLNSITLGNSLTSIRGYTFSNCIELLSIHVPASVTSIGTYAFYDCRKLAEYSVDSNNNNFSSLDGVLFNKEQTTLLLYPSVKTGSYSIPDDVENIDQYAFISCTSLTDVSFPDSMVHIGSNAFTGCTGLTEVTIPAGVMTIASYAFFGTNISSVTMGGNSTSIGGSAFPNNNILQTAYAEGGAGIYLRGSGKWVKSEHIYLLASPANATILAGADIPFSNNDDLNKVVHTEGATTVTVQEAGTYRIDYSVSTSAAIDAEVALAVNGVIVDSTSMPVSDGTGSTELSLSAGDVITLRNKSGIDITLELSPGIGAEMRIAKLY